MAKLIKLTSKDDLINNSNSFKCMSDEDIIIQPNSTIALLNAHISSGLLSTYNIDGSDVVGLDTGLNVASLYLTQDQSDRERKVVCRNGNYDITTMLQELTTASNKALMYGSVPTPLSNTSDVFNTPNDSDFGLMMSTVLDNSKVVINYNSAQQQATNFTFSNVNDGVDIDAGTGNITYTNPAGQQKVNLTSANASNLNKTIETTSDPTTAGFAVNDVCKIIDNTNNDTQTVIITNISGGVNNLTQAFDIVVNTADVVSSVNAYTQIPTGYRVGENIIMDDGTSTVNPTVNSIVGTIGAVNLVYANPFENVEECNLFNGYQLNYLQITKSIQGATADEIISHFDGLEEAELNANGIFIGSYIIFLTSTSALHAIGIVNTIVDDGSGGCDVNVINCLYRGPKGAGSVRPQNCNIMLSLDQWKTNDGSGMALDTIPTIDGTAANYDNTTVIVYNGSVPLFESTIEDITYDNGAVVNDVLFQSNKIKCLDANGLLLLEDFLGFSEIVTRLNAIGFDNTKMSAFRILISDKVKTTTQKIVNAGIGTGDAMVFDSIKNVVVDQYEISNTPFEYTDGYSYYPIVYNEPDDAVRFKTLSNNLQELSLMPSFLVKDNNTKILQLQLIPNPVVDLTTVAPALTRIWLGNNISASIHTITLDFAQVINLNTYNALIKGVVDKAAELSYALQDTRLAKSCGRIVLKVVNADLCDFGIMPETSNFLNQETADAFIRIAIEYNGADNVYRLYQDGLVVPLKSDIIAANNDRICIQWGVCPSTNDFEYNDTVNNATNAGGLDALLSIGNSPGTVSDVDRSKMLFSVSRNGATNNYTYIGSVDAGNLAKAIPWTPRASPFMAPVYYDNTGDYRVYVCPNLATIRLIELTKDPFITTVSGVTNFTYSSTLRDDSIHGQDHPELSTIPHRLNSFNNYWYWKFNDLYFAKQLGYKLMSYLGTGASGKFGATQDFLTAYLPENLVVFIDNLPCETYDLEKVKGTRRNIIGVCVSTSGKQGEIQVEPNNIYKISLGNKQPINMRKFFISFETFYGEQVILQSARAVVNLLIESP